MPVLWPYGPRLWADDPRGIEYSCDHWVSAIAILDRVNRFFYAYTVDFPPAFSETQQMDTDSRLREPPLHAKGTAFLSSGGGSHPQWRANIQC